MASLQSVSVSRPQTLLIYILSSLSFFLSLFIIVTYLTLRQFKFPSRLVLYFTLSVCGISICTLFALAFGDDVYSWSENVCIAQGTLLTFFSSAALLWWFVILLQVYLTFVLGDKRMKKYELLIHFICWSVAAALSVPAAVLHLYTPHHSWCEIGAANTPVAVFIAIDIVLGVLCIIGAGLWVRVVWHIVKGAPSYSLKRAHSLTFPARLLRQALFVFFFLIIFVFTLAHRIYLHLMINTVTKPLPPWMTTMHIALVCGQGILSFLIFGCRKQVMTMWHKFFERAGSSLRAALGYEQDVPLMNAQHSLNI